MITAPPSHDSNTELAGHAGEFFSSQLVRRFATGIVLAVLFAIGTTSALAEVKVDGSSAALRLDVKDVKLREVLNALQAKFNLRYGSNESLDGLITGSYSGPLRRVVARLLDGYDFVIAVSPDGLDALILWKSGTAAGTVAQASPPLPRPPTRAPAMTAEEANRYERAQSR